jgi:peptidoglycan/LPS O-acetylase OafA/YrhL
VVTALLATAAVVASDRVRFPAWLSPMRQLGVFSYSSYLLHVPLGVYVFGRLFPGTYPADGIYFLGQLAQVAATIALAWLFFRVAERPFLSKS